MAEVSPRARRLEWFIEGRKQGGAGIKGREYHLEVQCVTTVHIQVLCLLIIQQSGMSLCVCLVDKVIQVFKV